MLGWRKEALKNAVNHIDELYKQIKDQNDYIQRLERNYRMQAFIRIKNKEAVKFGAWPECEFIETPKKNNMVPVDGNNAYVIINGIRVKNETSNKVTEKNDKGQLFVTAYFEAENYAAILMSCKTNVKTEIEITNIGKLECELECNEIIAEKNCVVIMTFIFGFELSRFQLFRNT